MAIHHPTPDFDFNKLHLTPPVPVQGGSFYTKINFSTTDDPLYVLTPKGKSRSGVVVSGAKKYLDMVFTSANNQFLEWVSALEERLVDLIHERRATWFTEELERDDIQSVFISMIKPYKGQYVCRSYLQHGRQKIQTNTVQVYNEYETPRDLSAIKEQSEVISILEVEGVKFSPKSFQVVLSIKQIMVIEHPPTFNQCLIRLPDDKVPEINRDPPEPLKEPLKEAVEEAVEEAVKEAVKEAVEEAAPEAVEEAEQVEIEVVDLSGI